MQFIFLIIVYFYTNKLIYINEGKREEKKL